MKLFELFISEQLSWATRDNAERPNNYDRDDYKLLTVNVADVFAHVDSEFALDLQSDTGGKNAIGNRLDRAKKHFSSGKPMDPPEVALNSRNNKIEFSNGRHRAVAAHQLGHKYIPMFVYTVGIDQFKKLVKIK
jgi:hypothetical protein